ncbi:MAG TPA: glycine oxidase ThiO [Mycobacteriales bacterium]|nr:glycine oxidase ThiO [Mycobacteriales bacterium]
MGRHADVVVIGGGLIGLACAWRLAGRGRAVVVVDPAPASGASRAAAGMLAPVTEVHYGEERLLRLTLAAAAGYPDFVAELEQDTGIDVGYRRCGTLSVGFDPGDRAVLTDLHAFQRRLGLDVELLSGREARSLEPTLAPGVRGALLARGDHQVDNRRLAAALTRALELAGVAIRREPARALSLAGDTVTGVDLADGHVAGGTVVLAAGPWSGQLGGLPPGCIPVRPVKGQILRLATPPGRPLLQRSVRGLVGGTSVYLVPRASGEIVVGATAEEMGFDTVVQAGAVHALLRDAIACVPGVAEAELVEASAGLRPGTPDNAPLIGPAGPAGLVVATGHYRNGVLLTPITADAVASYVVDGTLPNVVAAFDANRFSPAAVTG